MKIAFDIDDTLYKIVEITDENELASLPHQKAKHWKQIPDYDLLQVLRWFVNNGDEVFVWSAGGEDYARNFVNKFGIEGVSVIRKMHTDKEGVGTGMHVMDIAFDDCETRLAKVDIRVKRNHETNP